MCLKKFLARVLPSPLKRALKKLIRLPVRVWTFRKRAEGVVISKQDIVNGLREMGIGEGDTIFVHSSFSSFGFVKNGPMEVINALFEVVGAKGNVCMPSFGPLPDGKTFDAREAPSALGKITDVFWRLPQAKRSLSPTHSVACVGKDAEAITSGHLLDKTPFSKNSPYFKAMKKDGKVVCLGSPLHRSLTCNYLVEDELGEKFPVKVYKGGLKEFVVIDTQGKKRKVLLREHDKSLDSIRVDWHPEIADWFEGILEERGCLSKGKIGEAVIRIYGIKCMADALRDLAAEGKTIYEGFGACI